MSFSLIKILEDLRTTHGKKAMYVHFSEEKTPVKRQRPSILTVQRMTRPREFCWKCQSLAYQLSHYLLHVSVRNYICTLTYIRWVFWDDPLAVWVMVHTLLLIDGVVKDNPQVTEMFCLSVWRACLQKARTCLTGTVVLPDTRAALCVFHQTASRSQPIPIEWKNCIYIRMNSQ